MKSSHMFFRLALLGLLTIGIGFSAGTKRTGLTLAVKYEGGTLPLNQGRMKATIDEDRVVFSRGNQTLSVPLENITAVACSAEIRRRFGATVLAAVPRMHLDKTESYYVGLTWTGSAREGRQPANVDAIFKLSDAEYRDFVGALERLTGRKATDTTKVPTRVRYQL